MNKVGNTAKMIEILTRLKTEKNGAVVDSMKEKGITYALSYGVSVPTIKEIAKSYYPDHALAGLLYRQDVRELKLAAVYVADPEQITPDDLEFWASGVVSSEIAEHLATVLLANTALVGEVLERWIVSGNMVLVYAALMTAARNMRIAQGALNWDARKVLLNIGLPSNGITVSEERYVWHGLSVFLTNLMRGIPESLPSVRDFLNEASEKNYPYYDYLESEIGWMLDSAE